MRKIEVVTFEVNLEDFETFELVEEVLDRFASSKLLDYPCDEFEILAGELQEYFKEDQEDISLLDQMKIDHFHEIMDKYSLTEIETLLPWRP